MTQRSLVGDNLCPLPADHRCVVPQREFCRHRWFCGRVPLGCHHRDHAESTCTRLPSLPMPRAPEMIKIIAPRFSWTSYPGPYGAHKPSSAPRPSPRQTNSVKLPPHMLPSPRTCLHTPCPLTMLLTTTASCARAASIFNRLYTTRTSVARTAPTPCQGPPRSKRQLLARKHPVGHVAYANPMCTHPRPGRNVAVPLWR